MSAPPTVDELFDFMGRVDPQSLRYEIKVLRAIKAWAVAQCCDFAEGDKVEMTDSLDLNDLHGWAHYVETMAPGATATAKRISFNDHYGYWYADIVFDREWSVGKHWKTGDVIRHWHGRVDETPEGYEPPSDYDQKHRPDGRKHTFSMPVRHLRASTAIPEGTPE